MQAASKPDFELLKDFFSVPVRAARRRREPKPITVHGVELHVQRDRGGWSAWYEDDHSCTYWATTRREVIADAVGDRQLLPA